MSNTDVTPKKKSASLLNWMGTLVLSAIPGINIISLILFVLLGKSRAKRTYAAAALILIALCTVLFVAAFFLFGEKLTELARNLAAE